MATRRATLLVLVFIFATLVIIELINSIIRILNSPSFATILYVAIGTFTVSVSLLIWLFPSPSSRKVIEEPVSRTKDIGIRVNISDNTASQLEDLNREQQEKEQELLSVEKQELALDRERFELERERQAISWQKEALSLVNISPRAAILIAWLGVEQVTNRIASDLSLTGAFSTVAGRYTPRFTIISLLRSKGIWRRDVQWQKDVENVGRMQRIRNQVAHSTDEKEITADEALEFVQQAIALTQRLTELEKQESRTEEDIL